ncbi:MAG TPA: hypothetical protein PKI46_02970 [Bacteroidales bacterium]|nr:hypothetical protein [Bacteroidales bacterium]
MKKITLDIDCSEEYCLKCQFVGTSHFGQKYYCILFRDKYNIGYNVELEFDEKPALKRCSECKEKVK